MVNFGKVKIGMEAKIFCQKEEIFKVINLDSKVWESDFSPYMISLYNRYSLFNKRQKISKTKTKGNVSGGGKKPRPQKGTGKARQGSIRSPQWVGGGIVFGPTGEQNYKIQINKKLKKNALKSLLSERFSKNKIFLIDEIIINNYNTKGAISILKKMKIENDKVLLVFSSFDEINSQIIKSFSNLKNIKITKSSQINVSNILNSRFLLFTEKALFEIEKRILENLKTNEKKYN